MYIRDCFVVLTFLVFASPAAALAPADLVGGWTTEWANSAKEQISGGGPLNISVESEGTLDGHQPAAGQDGVMNGEVSAGADGALVWSGQWVSVWPEGVTRGAFRFVFADADSFTGVWSTEDGEVVGAAWNGRRAPEH